MTSTFGNPAIPSSLAAVGPRSHTLEGVRYDLSASIDSGNGLLFVPHDSPVLPRVSAVYKALHDCCKVPNIAPPFRAPPSQCPSISRPPSSVTPSASLTCLPPHLPSSSPPSSPGATRRSVTSKRRRSTCSSPPLPQHSPTHPVLATPRARSAQTRSTTSLAHPPLAERRTAAMTRYLFLCTTTMRLRRTPTRRSRPHTRSTRSTRRSPCTSSSSASVSIPSSHALQTCR